MSKTLKSEGQEEASTKEKENDKKKGAASFYKLQNGKITRLRPECERCGPGHFMADHGDRYSCGRCGFTRYKPVEDKK